MKKLVTVCQYMLVFLASTVAWGGESDPVTQPIHSLSPSSDQSQSLGTAVRRWSTTYTMALSDGAGNTATPSQITELIEQGLSRDHGSLTIESRSAPEQHPIAAITGLQSILDSKASTAIVTTNSNGLMSSSDKIKLDGIDMSVYAPLDSPYFVGNPVVVDPPSLSDSSLRIPNTEWVQGNLQSVVKEDDPRLSDPRFPIQHNSTHFFDGDDPVSPADIGAVADDDERLFNAREPIPHALSHASDGSDPIIIPFASTVNPGLAKGDETTIRTNSDGTLSAIAGEYTGMPPAPNDGGTYGGRGDSWILLDAGTSGTFDHAELTAASRNAANQHPISAITNLQAALDNKAALASPALTGVPTVPTASGSTNTTQIANTAFVQTGLGTKANSVHTHTQSQVDGLVDALNGKASIAVATTTASGLMSAVDKTKLDSAAPLASPTFTGIPAAPTAATGTNSTQIATTAFVKNQGYATLASPALTGTPTTPTATATTSNTQVASTAFVQSAIQSALADIGSGFTTMRTFTSSGTFTATKTGAHRVTIVGGGGGGGKGGSQTLGGLGGSAGGTTTFNGSSAVGGGGGGGGGNASGGGGGGPGTVITVYMNLTSGTSYSVTIGAGGSGGTAQVSSGYPGGNGSGTYGGKGGGTSSGGGGAAGASNGSTYEAATGAAGGSGGVIPYPYGNGGGGGGGFYGTGMGGGPAGSGATAGSAGASTTSGGNGGSGGSGAVFIEY